MGRKDALEQWFRKTLSEPGPASGSRVLSLVALQCLRDVAWIAAFGSVAGILSGWIEYQQAASTLLWVALLTSLATVWLLQGAMSALNNRFKQALYQVLEGRFRLQLAVRQSALVRQRSHFFWQTVWTTHLPALTHWRFDYAVQKKVASVMPVIVLILIGYLNGFIALGLLLTLPTVPLFMILVGKGAAALHRRHFLALERLGSLFTDRVSSLAMLNDFQAYRHQASQLALASQDVKRRTMRVVGVAFLSGSVLDFFSTLSVALIAVFIGFSLLGEVSAGTVISLQSGLWILLTVPLLLSEMKLLGQFYHQKAQAEAAQNEAGEFLTLWDMPAQDKDTSAFTGFHATNFSVGDLLHAGSLAISPGQWIRVVGASGAGKSVLLEALAGQRSTSHSLLCDFAMLTQRPVIMPGTVRENLCLGDVFTDAALWDVICKVELDGWLNSLPDGLSTRMGEFPALSGGEAQRLSIARMLLCDKPVWLLDEPTAHLPAAQHTQIVSVLRRCLADKTVLWASHKPLPDNMFSSFWTISEGEVTTE